MFICHLVVIFIFRKTNLYVVMCFASTLWKRVVYISGSAIKMLCWFHMRSSNCGCESNAVVACNVSFLSTVVSQ